MFPNFALSIIFSLFLRFFTYILENPSLFPFWPFFCTSLDFSELPCYTITRCKTRKNQGLTRVSPISGVGHISTYMPPRHSSDVHASMPA